MIHTACTLFLNQLAYKVKSSCTMDPHNTQLHNLKKYHVNAHLPLLFTIISLKESIFDNVL